MTKFNQALIAAASSIALFGGALTLITPAANAYTTCSTNDFTGTTFCSDLVLIGTIRIRL